MSKSSNPQSVKVGDPVRPLGEFVGEGPRGKVVKMNSHFAEVEYTHGNFPNGEPIITHAWHEIENLVIDKIK